MLSSLQLRRASVAALGVTLSFAVAACAPAESGEEVGEAELAAPGLSGLRVRDQLRARCAQSGLALGHRRRFGSEGALVHKPELGLRPVGGRGRNHSPPSWIWFGMRSTRCSSETFDYDPWMHSFDDEVEWGQRTLTWEHDPTMRFIGALVDLEDRLKAEEAAGEDPHLPVSVYFNIDGRHINAPKKLLGVSLPGNFAGQRGLAPHGPTRTRWT